MTKRLFSIFLSVVMLFTMAIGLDFTAKADEEIEQASIIIYSDVDGATDSDIFTYIVYIDGELYTTVDAFGDFGEYYIIDGFVEIPATDYVVFSVPDGSSYEVERLDYIKPNYEIVEGDIVSGVARKYNYYETYTNNSLIVEKLISQEEYLAATDNESKTTVTAYYDNALDKRYSADEISVTSMFSESTLKETETVVGYDASKKTEYPVSITVTAMFNVRKPTTSLGKDTYYYTGSVTFKYGDAELSETYTTVPRTDKTTAKSNAVDTITPIVRSYASRVLDEVKNDDTASTYFTDSIEAMIPKPVDLRESTSEVKIVDKSTRIFEVYPYESISISYSKEENEVGTLVEFYGGFIMKHDHVYSAFDVVDPTCAEKGYTLYKCNDCSASYKDDFVNTVDHTFGSYLSNGDSVAATCSTPGITASTTAICTVCGAKDTKPGVEVPVLDHTIVPRIENRVAETCTTDGSYDSVQYCTKCRTEVGREKVKTNKLGHDYDDGVVTKKATCGATGVKTYTCKRRNCGATKKTTIKATGKHSYDDGKVTKKPTSSATGIMTYTCKTCGSKKTSTIAKLVKTSISGVTAKSKGFTVKWKKVSSATGYQVQYSTSSKFSSPKTVTITKNSTVSKVITKLSAKKKYYVRVRTYKTIRGTKYYSSWSTAKSITTKK